MQFRNHVHHEHNRGAHRIRDAEQNPQPAPEEPATVVSVIYVTAPKTFDGPIGGYKTMDGSDDDVPSQTADSNSAGLAKATSAARSEQSSDASPSKARATQARETQEQESESSQTPTATPKAKTATHSDSTSTFSSRDIINSSKTPLTDSIASKSIPTSQSTSAASSFVEQSAASSSSSSTPGVGALGKSQGMTGGAKAGLAIGILICIGALLAVIFCCVRRPKKHTDSYEKTDDEKGVRRTLSVQTTRTTATAPRLSLRPVTQFLPDLGSRRKSGHALAAAGGPAHHGSNQSHSEKAATSDQVSDPANPFGNHAEVTAKNFLPIQSNNPVNPFDNHAASSDEARFGYSLAPPAEAPAPLRIRTPTPEVPNSPGAARVERHNLPNQHNVSPARAASPAMSGTSDYSMTSIASGYLANGPPPSNVHRVQLDFKPSMDDELGLTAGQLVRLLHEYDDGWALCIRLDRSQQGVAPRTCLSARPVKPRPNRGAAPRGPPPPAMFGSPVPRPASPAGGHRSPSPYSSDPRSMSPTPRPVQRSMSPGPYGGGPQHPSIPPAGTRRRSNSASQVRERRNSPPGPSPMNPNASNIQRIPLQLQAITAPGESIPRSRPPTGLRKPVPGQAM